MRRVYLDHINGTPLSPPAAEMIKDYMDRRFGNPSSLHTFGDGPQAALEEARRRVAAFISADSKEICFVSCGTEANNLAVKGISSAYQKRGKHLITSAVEHESVLHSFHALKEQGFEVTYLPVDRYGMVDPDHLARALRSDTILVSIMLANHEVGTLQPVKEISDLLRPKGVVFHVDAVAAAGRIPLNVDTLGVDALSLAANQVYGPEGVGALYLRRGTRLRPLLDGGVQESGRRAGSENVANIVGFGRALELASEELSHWQTKMKDLQDRLTQGLQEGLDRIVLTGHPEQRLPGHVSLCLEFVEGEALVRVLSQQGIAASTGSACRDLSARKVSHVLEAIQLDNRLAQGSLVFSLGKDNSLKDIDHVLQVLPPLVEKLRSISPVYSQMLESQN